MDNNEINKPDTHVYAMNILPNNLNKEDIVGLLDGDYHINIGTKVQPVLHAPRRVPVALKDTLRAKLDRLVEEEIIAPVTAPTPWVNSLVVVAKKNGRLRLCLDPLSSAEAFRDLLIRIT